MTRQEALERADALIVPLLRDGDQQIFDAARRPNGTIDMQLLMEAALRARQRIADEILAGRM